MKTFAKALLFCATAVVSQSAFAGTFIVEVGAVPSPNGGGNADVPRFRVVNDTSTGTILLPAITTVTLTLDAASIYTLSSPTNFGGGGYPGIGLGGDNGSAPGTPLATSSSKSINLVYSGTNFDPGAYASFDVNLGPGTVNFRDVLFNGTNTLVATFSDGTSGQVTFTGNPASTNSFYSFNSSAVAAAVPEPSTWAMMLVGFGAVGATMRRRKTTARIQFA